MHKPTLWTCIGKSSTYKGKPLTYRAIAAITRDPELTLRVAACAAAEGESDPEGWVRSNLWQLATQPGWGETYATATTEGAEHPGDDTTLITDTMIRAAVQLLRSERPDE